MSKKYNISIQGEGTAEEILVGLSETFRKLKEDYNNDVIWNNQQYPVIRFPGEWVYAYSGVLRTEVNQIDE